MKTIKGGDKQSKTVKYKYATEYKFKMRAFAYDENGKKVYGAAGKAVSIKTKAKK